MRFIYINDSHLANKAPVSRIDDYNETIFDKLRFCFEYCKDNGIKTVIHGGDLFHSYKIKEEIGIKFVDLLQEYDLQFYYCYGNHDVFGNNRNHVDKTVLGFLKRYKQFHVLGDKPYEFEYGIMLNGYDCSDVVPPNHEYNWDPSGFYGIPPGKVGYKILVLHANIENTESVVINGVAKNSFVKDVETDANLVLCGHNHIGWKETIANKVLEWETKFVNPGSIARINYNESIYGYGPRLADIEIKKNLTKGYQSIIKYQYIPTKEAFDVKKIKNKKLVVRNKENFIEALQELEGIDIMADNFSKSIQEMFECSPEGLEKGFNPRVKRYLDKKIAEVVDA